VWDLGCGDGRFVRAFLAAGAARVLASDLQPTTFDDPRVDVITGGFPEASTRWGFPVPVDLVFMSLLTEHVADLRQFMHSLAALVGPETDVLIHHDNFFHPVGHHDHGLLSLDPQTFRIEPQGVDCWNASDKCSASAEHRAQLTAAVPYLWSARSEATRDPSACHRCNYYLRSQPWAHLRAVDWQATFPEPFFSTELNRVTPDQLRWFAQEAGFDVVTERLSWAMNDLPADIEQRFGPELPRIFTVTMRLRLGSVVTSG
jgi:2-polyprenyl-6-hydroxyphenyl methylase/3-demethylubiquinone-9 3-methyltransferase